MTRIRAVIGIIILIIAVHLTTGIAFAFSSTPISVSVKPNGKVHIKNYYMYSLGPCRAYPAPQITSSGEKLGKLLITKSMRKMNPNPCDSSFEYEVASVVYEAGSATGREEFTLYIHDGARFHDVKITVQITGVAAVEKNPATRSERPADHKKAKEDVGRNNASIILRLQTSEMQCKRYNDTFQLASSGVSIKKEIVQLASKEWTTSGIISGERVQMKLKTDNDEIIILANRDRNTASGRWASAECNGSATVTILE